MFTYVMRPLISRDNSARRFVAAPTFARRVCFSLSLFILAARAVAAFPPRRDASLLRIRISGSRRTSLPSNVLKFYLIVKKKTHKKEKNPPLASLFRESIFAGLWRYDG